MILKQQTYNAAIYCRLSSEDESSGESGSISTQRELLTQYCKEHGFNIAGYYIDDGSSGTNFERTGFEQMLNDIDAGKINMVLAKDLSRFGRNYIESGYFIEKVFDNKNVRFISPEDHVDTLYNKNETLMMIKNVLNDLYARDCSRKTKAAFDTKAKSGQFIGSRAPFGYKKSPEDKHKLIIDPEAAEVIRYIFRLAEEGYGYNRIAKTLRSENILNPNAYFIKNNPDFYKRDYWNKPYDWHTTSVRVLLNNMVYLGHMAFGKQRVKSINSKKKLKMPKEEWIIVENTHEPIISQKQWDSVHEILKSRKRENSTGEVQMFAGLLYCRDCGSALSYHSRKASKPKNGEYSCLRYKTHGKEYCASHYIRFDTIYEIVLEHIRKNARVAVDSQGKYLKALLAADKVKTEKQLEKSKKELKSLEKRNEELDRIIKKLYEDSALEKITESRFGALLSEYEQEQKSAIERINSLQEEMAQSTEAQSNAEMFIEYIKFYVGIEYLDAKILNQLIDKIYVAQAFTDPITKERTQQIFIFYKFVGMIDINVPLE